MLKVPSSVQRNARKGLELRKLYGRGGTPVGEASAKRLASGSVSLAFAKHVAEYFPRHAGDNLEQTEKSAKGPSNGYIAWLLWGGTAARDWLEKKMSKLKRNPPQLTEAEAKKIASVYSSTVKGRPYPKPSEFGGKAIQTKAWILGLLAENEKGKYVAVESYKNDYGYKDPYMLPGSVLWEIVKNHVPQSESIGKGTIDRDLELWKSLGLWEPKSSHHRESDTSALERVFLKIASEGYIYFNAAGSVWEVQRQNRAKNPLFMDAFHAGETFAKDRSSSRTPRYASFAEWWKAKGSKDAGAKFFDAEDAKDFWVKGMNSMKKKNPKFQKPVIYVEDAIASQLKSMGATNSEASLGAGILYQEYGATKIPSAALRRVFNEVRDKSTTLARFSESDKAKRIAAGYKANPSLPANASAKQIAAKLKQLSSLKALLENKADRKSHVKAERIAQQMKALAKRHSSGLKANPKNPYSPKDMEELTAAGYPIGYQLERYLPKHRVININDNFSVALKKAKSGDKVYALYSHGIKEAIGYMDGKRFVGTQRNPSLRGLKAIGKKVGGKVSKLAKASLSKAKASLKRLTPSGRRSTAALKRLREASVSDPLGKTKRAILEMRKASSLKAKNPRKRKDLKAQQALYNSIGRDMKRQASSISLHGKTYKVLASFGDTELGTKAANRYMEKHSNASVLTTKGGVIYLADVNDLGKRSNPKRKHVAVKRKPSRKRNSASASAELYEKFHGKPSSSILEIEEQWHIHKNLAQLGTLVEIKVLLNPTESKTNQRRATLAVPHSDNALKGVQLCSSEGQKKSLYLIGGDQSLPLKALGFTAADEKDLMYIGEVEELTYRTRKHFDQFKKIDYYHGLGEVSKVRPQLLYRSRDKKLLIAGGQYDVRPEGIVN